MKILVVLLFAGLFSSCCYLGVTAEQMKINDELGKKLCMDREVVRIFNEKKILKKDYPVVTGGGCVCVIRFYFSDSSYHEQGVVEYTPDEVYTIALQVQKISRELEFDKTIDIDEYVTKKTRFKITPYGKRLKVEK